MKVELTDDVLHDTFLEIVRAVIGKVNDCKDKNCVSQALLLLLVRMANTQLSIWTLTKHSPDDKVFVVDAGALLRCMFDAYLQANYIYKDVHHREERATLYLDFLHVERFKTSRKALRHDNALTKRLKASPLKKDGERHLQTEYDRVKDSFPVEKRTPSGSLKREPETRDKWYRGTLYQLAEAADRLDEYDTFATPFSGCIHSSALAVGQGPQIAPSDYVMFAATITARVLLLNIENQAIDVGENSLALVDAMAKSWLEVH